MTLWHALYICWARARNSAGVGNIAALESFAEILGANILGELAQAVLGVLGAQIGLYWGKYVANLVDFLAKLFIA